MAGAQEVTLLDYGAGNVQSVFNAIQTLGYKIKYVKEPSDITNAKCIIFPGVGAFGSCVAALQRHGYLEPLRQYLKEDRPYFGICLGMQTLFEASEESPGVQGLGLLPGTVSRFPTSLGLAVPHIAWSGVAPMLADPWPLSSSPPRCYYVHSFRVPMPKSGFAPWALACSEYGERFVCAVRKGKCVATQFHPEKSGTVGLDLLRRWLEGGGPSGDAAEVPAPSPSPQPPARRIIACLDVRSNEAGDLVVTKGDCYDVKEGGKVRNHGKPVELAERYYQDGADEVSFLNITAFRDLVLADQPMLEVLRNSAKRVFVPLTVGGGIRSYVDASGKKYSALEVADAYFRAGADKVSIGSDAVEVARAYYASGKKLTGETSIELISTKYGRQAVVVSIDPRRVYVTDPATSSHSCVKVGVSAQSTPLGPNGESYCWYCCTVKGGREDSDLDVVQLAEAVEALGAGELLLNCIDRDGQGNGYELELIRQVKSACSLPVIASSGAGCPQHFADALTAKEKEGGGADAALAAGIFHREEVPLQTVKAFLDEKTEIPVRLASKKRKTPDS